MLCGLCHTAGTVGRAPGQSWLQDVTALKDEDHLVRGWELRVGRETKGVPQGRVEGTVLSQGVSDATDTCGVRTRNRGQWWFSC